MNGEKSSIGLCGSSRRIGARNGSVAWMRNDESWFEPRGSTHETMTRPRTRNHRAVTRNWMKTPTKAFTIGESSSAPSAVRRQTAWPWIGPSP